MADYNEALAELKEKDKAGATAFLSYNPKCFYRAYFTSNVKSDVITNNMAETFNGYIINARTKHIISMMEEVRALLIQRVVTKRQDMKRSKHVICPRVQATLEKNKEIAAYCYLAVDVQARSCTCRRWNLTGVSCAHGVACIFFCHQNAEDYVDEKGDRHWPQVNLTLDPPPIKVGPGRPRKNRKKGPHEKSKSFGKLSRHGIEMTCTLCNTKGHNKRRCPNRAVVPTEQPPQKRARGRPKGSGAADQGSTEGEHTTRTAQPSSMGRGNKAIRGGRGSRGDQPLGAGVEDQLVGEEGEEGQGEGYPRAGPRIIGENEISTSSQPPTQNEASMFSG
ncbi:BTB/POZ domain-containing protein NPY1 [Bienertia sinuspersici]